MKLTIRERTDKKTTNSLNDEPKLIGFIMEYPDNSYSLNILDLTNADENTISEILYKYVNDGVSIRGDKDISLSDIM